MKPAILETARRKEEIYPAHVHWLGYDKDYNFLGYYSYVDGKTIQVDLEDDEVTPEKIVTALNELIAERDALKAQLEQAPDTSGMERKTMCSFSIRGDDPEYNYGLYSRKHAEHLIEQNKKTFGEDAITDVQIHEYSIVWHD
jgi:hypothetical protein